MAVPGPVSGVTANAYRAAGHPFGDTVADIPKDLDDRL